MIKSLTLENFQAFHNEVHFPLEKLNLIFGPNGAGKSSVFRALQILGMNSSSLLQGNINFANKDCDLRNFRTLVYQHDQSKIIKLGITFEANETFEGHHSGVMNSILADHAYGDPKVELDSGLRQLAIRFFSVLIEIADGGEVQKIVISAFRDSPNQATDPSKGSYKLSLVRCDKGWNIDSSPDSLTFLIRYGHLLEFVEDTRNSFKDGTWWDGKPNMEKFEDIPDWLLSAFVEYFRHENFVIGRNSTLSRQFSIASTPKRDSEASILSGYLSALILFVLKQYDFELSKMIRLPPLRPLPTSIEHSLGDDSEAVETIDYAPIQNQRRIQLYSKLLYEFTGRYKYVERRTLSASGSVILERLLFDEFTKSLVRFEDVGVGVSQVLPILNSAYQNQFKALAIEQPELHLHPKLQSNLMDFFIQIINGFGWTQAKPKSSDRLTASDPFWEPIDIPAYPVKPVALGQKAEWDPNLSLPRSYPASQILLETHSENLLLRLQRRISEGAVSPESVSIIYIDSAAAQQVKILSPAEDYDYLSYWPKSFVDLRIEEIFGPEYFDESDLS